MPWADVLRKRGDMMARMHHLWGISCFSALSGLFDAAERVCVRSGVSAKGDPVEFRFGAQRVVINMPDRSTLEAEIQRRWRAGEGFGLATLNLDHLVQLPRNRAFLDAYAAMDLVVADGNPVVWLSRLAGRPVDLMPGSDLVLPLARLAAEEGITVALIGSRDAVLEAAAAAMEQAVPGLKVVMTRAPSFGFDPEGDEARAILEDLTSSGARLCILALGAVKQERLAMFARSIAPQVGFGCFGAGLDFLGGFQRRAPAWVQAIKMEWLWRAVGDPVRLVPRYARCAAILPGHVVTAWKMRGS
jgi:exopolysaccharide biosynthesis WecB/TagA/CpsF family protein